MLTVRQLAAISENPDPVAFDLAGDVAALVPEMRKAKITTAARVRAFLANVVQETDRLKTLKEYGDRAYYRSFLGSQWMYHGRGYIMNTWEEAYVLLSEELGVDLVDDPKDPNDQRDPEKLARNKKLAAKAAVWFWEENNLNWYADRGRFKDVCSIINTGSPGNTPNGWADRQHFYQNALRVIPDGFDLGAAKEENVDETRRVVFPEIYHDPATARRVASEVTSKVDLPDGKFVIVKETGRGERVAIPQKFTSLPTAIRVRDEIREKVDLPDGKTVVLHKPRQAKPPKREPARPKTDRDRVKEDVKAFFELGGKLIGTPYGDGWEEGTWPALASLYSRIGRSDPASYYRNHEMICTGFGNVGRYEIAGEPSFGWKQGDGWPGGTAAFGRHLAEEEGTRPYPLVANTPEGWAVFAPYQGPALRFQGHFSVADGKGKVWEARPPALSHNRTEDQVHRALRAGGAVGNRRIAPPEVWMYL